MNTNSRYGRSPFNWIGISLLLAFLMTGCEMTSSVSNPLTPGQTKAQVADAAREVVALLKLHGADGNVWLESCAGNSDEDPPYRAAGLIGYPKAPSFAESDAQVADMLILLQKNGWVGDPNFHSHGSVLKKNGVVVDFAPQNNGTTVRTINLTGECRDTTTTKATKGRPEPIVFGP